MNVQINDIKRLQKENAERLEHLRRSL